MIFLYKMIAMKIKKVNAEARVSKVFTKLNQMLFYEQK